VVPQQLFPSSIEHEVPVQVIVDPLAQETLHDAAKIVMGVAIKTPVAAIKSRQTERMELLRAFFIGFPSRRSRDVLLDQDTTPVFLQFY
jgi:hypothetical protein